MRFFRRRLRMDKARALDEWADAQTDALRAAHEAVNTYFASESSVHDCNDAMFQLKNALARERELHAEVEAN